MPMRPPAWSVTLFLPSWIPHGPLCIPPAARFPLHHRRARQADAVVVEAELLHLRRLVQVAAVEDDLAFHERLHAVEVGLAEGLPLGEDRERVGPVERVVLVLAVGDPVSEFLT